ncbi:hypothetical protein [Lentibacillus cibarius]|uniref:DUF5348 domain-containing protein n=1 Tax=Lentibacillus cibarius TaxID=2583219 RepID=A0A5S3QHY6_9BACI|nr:hypothetical protein [Lentibacillus cibarius]TMN20801.1 hypothetical protein FFL34_00745 [Lentibacillus cibarius]
MKRSIMMFDSAFGWVIWIRQTAYQVFSGDSMELRINNQYYQVVVISDTDAYRNWTIELDGVAFNLRKTEVYKVHINTADYKPYVVPF